MTEDELREALRVHGFGSLNEFLDLRDKICTTSSEIKHKLLREELVNEEGSKEKSEEEEEIWCTECPYFEDVVDDASNWFGALCKKDWHETSPSMYAIQSLHNDCPLIKDKEDTN